MKKLIVILVPIISVCAAVLLVMLFLFPAQAAAPTGRLMDIRTYVTQQISELSPQKSVLGGTFHVTDVAAADGGGVVHYEDGHIALVADFTYEMNETEGIKITTFTVRK